MIGNLIESFLYDRLPDAVINNDERGYIEAVLSGYQDRLEDLRSYAKHLDDFWVPGALPTSTTANVVLVDLVSANGKRYTRTLDIQADTPTAESSQLPVWVSRQLAVAVGDLSNVRYGYDYLRAVDVNTLSWLAATLGTLLYQTDLLADDAEVVAAQTQLVSTWFPRLKIKGTAQSFEVLGRILGFDDVRVTPLWTRLSPRVPDDIGNAANSPDFSSYPEYFPTQETGPFYDPFRYRDGPFFSWTGTASNGTNSTQFYTQTVNQRNPWISVVLLGSLAGTNVPAISSGTVVHPATGSYALANGDNYVKAYVDPEGSSVRFQALAEGADFNGLYVHVETTGTLAVITIEDRLSAIKYRSSYFDLGLTADADKIEDIFGSRAATTNQDLKDNPTLTVDGTAVSPYRPWISGSYAVTQTTTDWLTTAGTVATVVVPRTQADPGQGDRQLNMDSVEVAGVQVTQALEEVRAATRLPRRSQSGILINDENCYAQYTNVTDLFTTAAGTTVYAGSSASTPTGEFVADIAAILPSSFYVSWLGVAGNTYYLSASYDFAPYVAVGTVVPTETGQIYFYDPVVAGTAAYALDVPADEAPSPSYTTGTISGGVIPLKSEINPLNQNEYLYGVTDQNTSYTASGSYNFSTGSYYLATENYAGVVYQAHWHLTDTEIIRPEPVSAGTNVSCLCRPEDEDNGLVYEMADDFPWRREVVVGGELVELDTYQSGTELDVQVLEEATAFTDQTGVDLNVFGITNVNSPAHPRMVSAFRSTESGEYQPAYLPVGYRGTLKSLSALTSAETELVRPPIGSSVGDTETDYDVLFEPGYALYHVGLAQGVLVADLPKFFGAQHREGLVGWFAFNEHVDDDLTVVDHSFRATPTVLANVSYGSRQWDDERGWNLQLNNAQVVADEYRDVTDEMTLGFWIKLTSAPTVETRVVDCSPLYFTLKPGGILTGYAKKTNGNATAIGIGFVGGGTWHFVYIRRNATTAVFGIGDLTTAPAESNVPGTWAVGDPDADTFLYVQAYDGASYAIHDLRIWNVYKTQDQMNLVRYHAPTPTLCTYRLGFAYTLDRQDKWGVRVLPSGWATLDVLPAWYRRTRQGLVLRYDSMGSYHGETRFKEVGMGDQRRVPDVYTLGQQFVTMVAEGTAPFSTGSGALPGWNPLWQASNYAGNFDVLPFSGSTASGIVPVSTASGTTTPWPNHMDQTNPFRQYVYVNTLLGDAVYEVSLSGNATSTWLEAVPVVHGRTTAEAMTDPYLSELLNYGTVYEAFGTGFIQGTMYSYPSGTWFGTEPARGWRETQGVYGFYDPVSASYYAKTFAGSNLFVSDLPTGAYVLLSGQGSAVLVANPDAGFGQGETYTGTNTTPPLYMYTTSRTMALVNSAGTAWVDRTPDGQPPVKTPDDNDVDPTAMPSVIGVNAYGTYLAVPALGKAGILEFDNSGTLQPGAYQLTVVSGQIGQMDADFDGFAVDINVNDTVIQRRLLRGSAGYNFSGTDVFEFDLEDGVTGNYIISFDWTNPYDDPSRGTKRQLAIFAYALKYITTELFKVEVQAAPSTALLITPLYTDDYNTGTTPGGWFTTINSYGTQVGWEHESDIYAANENVTAIYPLGDTLSPLTNERRNDVIYTGTDVVVGDEGSYAFPSFGSVVAVPVYNPPLWFWSGALTSNPSATVTARMTYETAAVRLAVSETLDFGTRLYSDYGEATVANAQRVKLTVEGLQPWTTYYYAVENAGSLYTDYVGTLTTFGTGPRSFSFGVASCENNTLGSTFLSNPIWPLLHSKNVQFMLQIGDWHYYNINTNDVNRYRDAYDNVLSEAYHNQFYQQHSVFYVWDDHDFGPNDSDSTSASKPAARAAYRETVPHYPLAAGDGNKPIYQSFTVGRCRFIIADCVSERTPFTVADDNNKVVLGTEQMAWLKSQLLAASSDPDVGATFMVLTFPWTGTGSPAAGASGRSYWAAYPTQRAELATFIKDNDIQRVFILSGDMHATAFDDGRTYDFAADGTNPYPGGQFAHGLPVFQTAPLAQSYSSKGTPYLIGPMLSAVYPVQQVGVVTVYDYGTNLLINFCAYDETGAVVTSAGTAMNYTLNGTASPRP